MRCDITPLYNSLIIYNIYKIKLIIILIRTNLLILVYIGCNLYYTYFDGI